MAATAAGFQWPWDTQISVGPDPRKMPPGRFEKPGAGAIFTNLERPCASDRVESAVYEAALRIGETAVIPGVGRGGRF
jgi:hypothetical protein